MTLFYNYYVYNYIWHTVKVVQKKHASTIVYTQKVLLENTVVVVVK